MAGLDDIVITGIGCVTPLGIGREALTASLLDGKCAVRKLITLDDDSSTTLYGASIDDFNGKLYVKPRKAIKVMSRAVQMAYTAAQLAWQDAGLAEQAEILDSDRMGVVFGSELLPCETYELESVVKACSPDGKMDFSAWGDQFAKQIFPLWMLRNLPNMPACHVGIAIDARGPNNTIAQEEVSGLLSISEAAKVIERGQADLMVAGGLGGRVSPTRLAFHMFEMYDQHPLNEAEDSSERCVPFDKRRRGIVPGEGSGALILERRRHAVARGAKILARLAGVSSRYAKPEVAFHGSRASVAAAASQALLEAEVDASELDHVNTQGFSHPQLDIEESIGLSESVGKVPVTAASSYFGSAGAASGIVELIASLIAMDARKRLPVLGHSQTAPECPVVPCLEKCDTSSSYFLKSSFTMSGQAAAAVFECES